MEFQSLENNPADCSRLLEQNNKFDVIIGHIEDILVDSDFQNIVSNFMERYYKIFERKEENKLIYMDIFREYTNTVETFIDTHLTNRIYNFSMKEFLLEIEKNKSHLDGEVFEILFTISDFLTFKEMMLDYKNVKEGLVADFSSGICIQGLCKLTTGNDET